MNQTKKSSQIWMLAHPSMSGIASSVELRCLDSSRKCYIDESEQRKKEYVRQMSAKEERSISYKQSMIRWDKFKDGFPNLFIENVRNMAGKDVIFIGSFHSPEVIFEQLSILYAIPRYLARSFTFILPYFPTGTMERVQTEGQIATAKTLATLLSCTPLTSRGPAQIMVFDIHALQERFYFSENVIPRLETAIPLLIKELKTCDDFSNIAIAFPDDGAHKRFAEQFVDYSTIVCSKVRIGNDRVVKVKDGNPAGKHIVIVDDLVQTGGTLIECAKALLAEGASEISAYVTHAVFPQKSWLKFTELEPRFSNFWITDSLPHTHEIVKHEPFKLLSLADAIADILLSFDLLQ